MNAIQKRERMCLSNRIGISSRITNSGGLIQMQQMTRRQTKCGGARPMRDKKAARTVSDEAKGMRKRPSKQQAPRTSGGVAAATEKGPNIIT